MPCPFASNDVTAVASSVIALSSVVAGSDAKRIVKFQSGDTSSRSSNTPPATAAASSRGPLSVDLKSSPAAPKPSAKLKRKRGDVIDQKVRPASESLRWEWP